jgi:hypothetical protein
MSSRLNARVKYLCPPVALDAVRWCRAMLRYPSLKPVLDRNRAWSGRHAGERVYVIGNGPSAGAFDRRHLQGHKTIVMNAFHHAPWKDEVDIVAHCLGEPRSSTAWDVEDLRRCVTGTRAQSYWLHESSRGALTGLPADKALHYVMPCIEAPFASDRHVALHRPVLGYQTTAQLAIEVAIYMGFTEIVLVGFDHDWLANPDYSRHFYSTDRDSADMLHQFTYLQIVRIIDRMWSLYYKLQAVAAHRGVKITNAAPGSYLDVFPRVDLGKVAA